MRNRFALLFLPAVLALVVACADDVSDAGTPLAVVASATPVPTATPTLTPSATPSPQPTATATPAPTPTPDAPDPQALLDGALRELDDTRSFQVITEAEIAYGGDGGGFSPETRREVVYQSPDRSRGDTSWLQDGETYTLDHVVVGEAAFVALPDAGVWEHAPAEFPAPSELLWRQELGALTFVGEERVEGRDVYHVRGSGRASGALLLEALGESYVLDLVRAGQATQSRIDLQVDFYIERESGRLHSVVAAGQIFWSTFDLNGRGESGELGADIQVEALFEQYDQLVEIRRPENVAPAAQTVSTPYGDMRYFRRYSPEMRVAIPNDWQQVAGDAASAEFAGPNGGLIYIAREDTIEIGLGRVSLEEYVDILVIVTTDDAATELVSREVIETPQGNPAEILTYSIQGGAFTGQRFVYLHANQVAFNILYASAGDDFPQLEPLVDYSFNSFQVGPALGPVSVWHSWGLSYFEEIEAVFIEHGEETGVPYALEMIAGQEIDPPDLSAAVLTGTGPDILAWPLENTNENIARLTDYFDPSYQRATYAPVAAEATIGNGEVWGVPFFQEAIAIVYNRELVDAADLPADPADFDGLLAAAQAYRTANPDGYLVCNPSLGPTSHDFYHAAPIFFGFAGEDERGFIDDEGNVYVDTPERLAAAEWLVEFAAVSPSVTSHLDCLEGIRDGTYAAWWTGPRAIADLEAAGIDYGILPFGRPYVGVTLLMMGLNVYERDHEALVIETLRHFGSAEVQVRLALANNTVPANLEALADPQVQARYSVAAFGEAVNGGVLYAGGPYAGLQAEPLGEMVRRIVSGAMTPAEALAAAQAELEALVAESG